MTANDLKTLVSRDLEGLPPMPTVVPEVLAESARRQRRRRIGTAGLAAATAAGVVAAGVVTLPDYVGSTDSSVAERSDAPVTQTRKEFREWAAGEFSAILPARFSDVRSPQAGQFVTRAEGIRVRFNINLGQNDRNHSRLNPSKLTESPRCGGEVDSCAASRVEDAIAYHGTSQLGLPYAGMEMHLGDRSATADEVALSFSAPKRAGAVPLSNDEILDLVAAPRFEAIWREYAAHPDWVSIAQDSVTHPPAQIEKQAQRHAQQRRNALKDLRSRR